MLRLTDCTLDGRHVCVLAHCALGARAAATYPSAQGVATPVLVFWCWQVPRIVHQAYLRTPGASCDVHNDIPCEPVVYRMPVSLATWSSCIASTGRYPTSCRRVTWQASSQLVIAGFTCARRNKQLQRWSNLSFAKFYDRTIFDWPRTRPNKQHTNVARVSFYYCIAYGCFIIILLIFNIQCN